jgi:hypothetical protein
VGRVGGCLRQCKCWVGQVSGSLPQKDWVNEHGRREYSVEILAFTQPHRFVVQVKSIRRETSWLWRERWRAVVPQRDRGKRIGAAIWARYLTEHRRTRPLGKAPWVLQAGVLPNLLLPEHGQRLHLLGRQVRLLRRLPTHLSFVQNLVAALLPQSQKTRISRLVWHTLALFPASS